VTTPELPESLQSIIQSRFDRLEPALKQVLQCASVIGRLFRPQLLERVLPDGSALDPALWMLEEQQFIYQERVVPEVEYSFRHVLTQEAIYASLLRRRRAELHQQVAEAIEALFPEGREEQYGSLAYHYERSPADEKAIEYLLLAGERSLRAYLNEEAIRYFRQALTRLDRCAAPGEGREARLRALKGLGQTYFEIGREAEAEEPLRLAIAVAREIGLPPLERAPLYHWLGAVLHWMQRDEEAFPVCEEGHALLGEHSETLEAALMNHRMGLCYSRTGNRQRAWEFALRNASFIERLPYSAELRHVYGQLISTCMFSGDVEAAADWLRAFRRRVEGQHDSRSLAHVHQYTFELCHAQGDLHGWLAHARRSLELETRVGNERRQSLALGDMGRALLEMGDLQKAEEVFRQRRRVSEEEGDNLRLSYSSLQVGWVLLCRGAWEEAEAAFREGEQALRQLGLPNPWVDHLIGRLFLARGRAEEAVPAFAQAIAALRFDHPIAFLRLAQNLSGLEAALANREEFGTVCRRLREERPELADLPFSHWFLEPAEPSGDRGLPAADCRFESGVPEFQWVDPFGDCSWVLESGLVIRAANGRDLWEMNRSAPRLLRSISGEFTAQADCVSAAEDRPVIGGLLLWKDGANFLRLDRGASGSGEITFAGCIENQSLIIGRGRLVGGRITLRLERRGAGVRALCSADGARWFCAGQVEFPLADPVEIGLHAIGNIPREIYHGAYPDGTAIRFESFQLWS
jgi:tetratricopeptide (TPR) repeat protein/regulation of enolase protein 1 (concanavalin A-like superfamily)